MYKELSFKIRGVAPLIMHNGQLADPLNEWAQTLKKVTSKRNKTDDDHREMSRIEFLGGLYLDDKERPIVPGINVEAMLISAGKKQKLGNQFKAGIISEGPWLLEYDGPKAAKDLWENKRFVDRRGAGVQQSKVMRTRPIFKAWSLAFTVNYLPDLLNPDQIVDAVRTAGQIIGLCDYIPRYGRFEVV